MLYLSACLPLPYTDRSNVEYIHKHTNGMPTDRNETSISECVCVCVCVLSRDSRRVLEFQCAGQSGEISHYSPSDFYNAFYKSSLAR